MSNTTEINIKRNEKLKITLSETQTEDFKCDLKNGILKQLHKKRLLTDEQLQLLIKKQEI